MKSYNKLQGKGIYKEDYKYGSTRIQIKRLKRKRKHTLKNRIKKLEEQE